MKRILCLVCLCALPLIAVRALAPILPGYWQMSYVANDWVDWQELVVDDVIYGADGNTGDFGPYGEWINSFFYTPSVKTYNLKSRSEGTIRLRFDWIGGGTPPSQVTFDIYTEAIACLSSPNGYDELEFYQFCDGVGGEWDITPTFVIVESGTSREGSVLSYGATPVYYEIGILNSISGTFDDEGTVMTMTTLGISNIE